MATEEEWLSNYPAISDPNFSGLLAEQAEFSVLAGRPKEPTPTPGAQYKHQQLFQRLYDVYSRVLVMDAPGTGKTCLVAALTEFLYWTYAYNLKHQERSFLKPPSYKTAYVLVKGDIVSENFKRELACQCTRGVYDTIDNPRATENAKKYQVSRSIGVYYKVMTYTDFYNEAHNYSDEQLIQNYSGCVFIIDEAHNLNPKESTKEDEILRSEKIYNHLHRLFHLVSKIKIVLLSATPSKTAAVEQFAVLLNLLRPLAYQMPSTPADMAPEEFASWLHGYIMYVRELDTQVDLKFQGLPIAQLLPQYPEYTTKVWPLQMSEFQSRVYAAAYAANGNKKFYEPVRQATDLVYPNGAYGNQDGFKNYVTEDGKGRWSFTAEMISAVNAARIEYPENPIRKFSTKFAFLSELITQKHSEGKKGYVYLEFKEGSGVIPLGLFLEQVGIERFYEMESVFPKSNQRNSGVCPIRQDDVTDRIVAIPKRLRYGLLIPDNPANINKNLIELYNSPENVHGEYIAALLFSPFGREAISLDSVQWLAENPTWVWSSAKQSIYRGRRATSHLRLTKNNPNARIDLEVYLMAGYPGPPAEGTFSVDFHIFVQSETTARLNAPYIEMARAVANDCWLERQRNIRPGDADKNGMPECDYGNCDYQCFGLGPSVKDYSGLLRKYADEYRGEISKEISTALLRNFAIPVENVLKTFETPRAVVLLEISRLIESRQPFRNRFGQQVYLHLSGGYLVASADYPQTATNTRKIRQYEYLTTFPGVLLQPLGEFLKLSSQERKPELTARFELPLPQFQEYLNTATIEEKAWLVEAAVVDYVSGGGGLPPATRDYILERYRSKIHTMMEPVSEIRDAIRILKAKPRKNQNIPAEPLDAPATVFLHTVENISASEMIRYNMTTASIKPLKIRIYRPGSEWRDVNEVEIKIYQKYIADSVIAKEQEIQDNFNISGMVITDDPKGVLYTIDNEANRLLREQGITDGRKQHRGHACNTWSWEKLGDIFYRLGLTQPHPEIPETRIVNEVEIDPSISAAELERERVVRKWPVGMPPDKIRWYIAWANANNRFGSDVVCNVLRAYFTATGSLAVR